MRKLYLLVLLCLLSLVARAQVVYAPSGVNYGKGFIVQRSFGNGAPNPLTCSGFKEYWQMDATTSPFWMCLSGNMVNVGGSTTGGGTSSYAVTTTATGLQTLSGPLQATYFTLGQPDTQLFRCGADCFGVGSTVGTPNGTLSAGNYSGNVNGIAVATKYPGADIGAKVNAAFSALIGSGTVYIPAGNYTFTTTINIPGNGYHIDCDAGVDMTYTGTGNAIAFPNLPPDGSVIGIEGNGGCELNGTNKAGVGIYIPASNHTFVRDMHIANFDKGIYIAGGNHVNIENNKIENNNRGISLITVTNYAPNAIHVSHNEIQSNGWGYYSENGHVSATRALGNTIRDNVFETNTLGDAYLNWDAHTLVEGNYFESAGAGVKTGDTENVYDIRVLKNYFTNGPYRSEVEVGYGWDVTVEGNYSEGSSADSTNCALNIMPGASGSVINVTATNAFAQNSEGTHDTYEVCDHGAPITSANGTYRIVSGASVGGSLTVGNRLTANGFTQIGGTTAQAPPFMNIGPIGVYSTAAPPGGTCGGTAIDIGTWGMYVCQNGVWTAK